SDLLADLLAELGVGDLVLGGRDAAPKDVEERRVLPLLKWHVDREIAAAEPLLHLDDLALLHVEPLREELRPGDETLRLEPILLLLEIEEELPLRLGGTELHHAPVVHDIA